MKSSSLQKKQRSGPFARYIGGHPRGRDLDDGRTDRRRHVAGAVQLVAGQARGDADHREHPVSPERADGEREEEARVHAPGEGDAEAPDRAQRHTTT